MSTGHSMRERASRRRRRLTYVARLLVVLGGFVLPSGGRGALGAQGPSAPLAGSEQTAPRADRRSASRAPAEIVAAGQRYAAVVHHCYEEAGLKGDPMLKGLLRVAMTVLPGGDVRAATVTARHVSGLGMPDVVACVASAARAWRFGEAASRVERAELWFDLLPTAR
jgi:hypothetical protein